MVAIKSHKYRILLISHTSNTMHLSIYSKDDPSFCFRMVMSNDDVSNIVDLCERFLIKLKRSNEVSKEKDQDNLLGLMFTECCLDNGTSCVITYSSLNAGSLELMFNTTMLSFPFNQYDANDLLKILNKYMEDR